MTIRLPRSVHATLACEMRENDTTKLENASDQLGRVKFFQVFLFKYQRINTSPIRGLLRGLQEIPYIIPVL